MIGLSQENGLSRLVLSLKHTRTHPQTHTHTYAHDVHSSDQRTYCKNTRAIADQSVIDLHEKQASSYSTAETAECEVVNELRHSGSYAVHANTEVHQDVFTPL